MSDNEVTLAELKGHLEQATTALVDCEKRSLANQLTAAVLHEVNNPLEAIINLTYLLEAEAGMSPEGKGYLAILKGQLDVLTHITRSSLSFYRDQAAPQDVDLVTVVRACLKLHSGKLAEHKIRVYTRYSERALSSVIASEILQIVSNLILNAIDVLAAEPAPALHVRVHRCQHGIHITVADNGPGIPDEIEAKLFIANVTGKKTGTGIGLWLSKSLIAKHGGEVKFRTWRAEGKSGTVFRVWFPHANAA